MIVGMTKYSFLIYHREYEEFLDNLRELGTVHVVEKQTSILENEPELQVKLAEAKKAEQTIKEMKKMLDPDLTSPEPVSIYSRTEIVPSYDALLNEKLIIEQELTRFTKDIDRIQIWGNFKWEQVKALQQVGYQIRFYTIPSRKYNPEWEETYNAFRIAENGSQVYLVTINHPDTILEMDGAEQVNLPANSLSELKEKQEQLSDEIAKKDNEIKAFCQSTYNSLSDYYREILEGISYEKVIINTENQADNKLKLLEGWIPTVKEAEMNQFLDSRDIFFISQRATKDDIVPIKLRNNKFARLFHPITELYEMPTYSEIDLTPFFAPFFVMFFGLCLGDAGYGVLLFIIGLIARKKVKADMKPIMTLVSILGFGTMVFGFISGTLFGIELLKVDWPWIQKFKTIMLNSDQLFAMSLIIGVVQILFGMTIKAVGTTMRFGFKNALSNWGWLLAIVGCGGAFGLQKYGFIPASTAKIIYYIAGGVASLGIFIFNDIKRNPLINIGAGLWDSYNMATGLLGDILSYVRLFALGISGAVLGLVFNDLAAKMSPDIPVVGFLVSAIILIFGHSMNIFMSGLGAFVHPMRLTFVEFYKNAGFEGGGKKYNPFSRIKKE
jgi:V/A-type H+/Na+-transporting ATPase subunit I